MTKLEKVREALKAALLQFARIPAEGGFELEVSEDELAEGLEVSVFDGEGNKLENPDGEYMVEGKKVTVLEGKIKSIEAPEEEVKEEVKEEVEAACGDKKKIAAEGEELPAAEEPKEDERDARIKELEAEIAEKVAEIEGLKAKIAELEAKPAAAPLEEEFAKVTEPIKTGNKKIDRLCQILNAK